MANMAKYEESEVLSMHGIVLEKENSYVEQKGLFLQEINRAGNKVTLKGFKTLSGKEPVEYVTTVRSCLYIHEKSQNRQKAFSRAQSEQLQKSTECTLKPAYSFYVNVLVEHSSKVGYGLTWEKLVFLNETIFQAYLKGEQPKKVPEIVPFEMGVTTVKTTEGQAKVMFGLLNGNSGIKVVNPAGVMQKLATGKHTRAGVPSLCNYIKNVLQNKELMKAKTTEEFKEIYSSFNSTSM